jgi:hypothetical protein
MRKNTLLHQVTKPGRHQFAILIQVTLGKVGLDIREQDCMMKEKQDLCTDFFELPQTPFRY